jgi:hypothetical protein
MTDSMEFKMSLIISIDRHQAGSKNGHQAHQSWSGYADSVVNLQPERNVSQALRAI